MTTRAVPRREFEQILTTHIGVDRDLLRGAGGLTLVDLGVDSIGVIELGKVLNDQFTIELPDEASAMTLDQIAAHLDPAEQKGA